MTDKARRIVEALRICGETSFRCEDCPVHTTGESCMNDLDAADLIEELSEELEHAQQEKAGLEIMLTATQSAAETWKRKLDAAIWDLKTKSYYCESCAHYKPGHFCLGCRNKSNYEWHGV